MKFCMALLQTPPKRKDLLLLSCIQVEGAFVVVLCYREENLPLMEPQTEGEKVCLFICPYIQPGGDGCL